jgi:uncharacterized protein YndB with AHSA1/START domain
MRSDTEGTIRAIGLKGHTCRACSPARRARPVCTVLVMSERVEVERHIDADPERVWTLVSDLPRMGEWSPEATGGRWLRGATGPSVGARFKGKNSRGRRRWSTVCTVVEAEPGRVFAFDVDGIGLGVSRWEYRIEPDEGGCIVRERWTDRRGGLMRVIGKAASGIGDRAEHNRAGMEETLRRLAATAESR